MTWHFLRTGTRQIRSEKLASEVIIAASDPSLETDDLKSLLKKLVETGWLMNLTDVARKASLAWKQGQDYFPVASSFCDGFEV